MATKKPSTSAKKAPAKTKAVTVNMAEDEESIQDDFAKVDEQPPADPLLEEEPSQNSLIDSLLSTPMTPSAKITPEESVTEERYTLALPPTVEVINPSSTTEIWEFRVFSSNCLACSKLVGSANAVDHSKAKKCGPDINQHCPAIYSRVAIQGRRATLVQKLKEARQENNLEKITRVLTALQAEGNDTIAYVYREIGLMQPT